MTRTGTRSAAATLGFRSATLATVFSLTYVVGQLAEWAGWLGSRGGPESISTPLGLVVLLTPSLLLGPAFVVLLVCTHETTPRADRVWSLAALSFGIAYLVLIGMNYFVQLTLVAPRMAQGRTAGIEGLLFVPFDSFLYAVDILGYSFMSVATLFAAPLFRGPGIDRAIRLCLLGNGLLLPFLALQMYWHPLIWIASLWAVTFPGATWMLAIRFRRLGQAVGEETVGRAELPARGVVGGSGQTRQIVSHIELEEAAWSTRRSRCCSRASS